MTANLFALLVTIIIQTSPQKLDVQTVARPYQTAEQCLHDGKDLIDHINQEQPPGLVAMVAQCVRVDLPVKKQAEDEGVGI